MQVADIPVPSNTKPEISGIYFEVQKNLIILTGTDSFKLGEKKIYIKETNTSELKNPHTLIIPQKTAKEVINIFGEKDSLMRIYFSPNQIMFERDLEETKHPEVQLVSRLIEGEYPNYWKEFRLDYSKDFQSFPQNIINEKTILTIRSIKKGGKYEIEITEKIEYYKKIISDKNCLCDLEINRVTDQDISSIPRSNLILSYHNFSEIIDFTKLKEIVKRSNSLPSKFLKIAVNIHKYSDLIKLSQIISESKKPVIFAGMGKLGKISRILFRHLGADATFIGLTGNPTADGQLTLEETDFFSLNSISKKTQIGGIIGGEQVIYSLGIKYYNDLFIKEKLDAVYLPFATDDIHDLWNWINNADIDFYGFSITMPFKKILGAKKQLSAMNLFLPKTNEMLNTDLIAFQETVEILKIKKADSILIIGSGATAEIALKAFQIFDNITISARNEIFGKKLAKRKCHMSDFLFPYLPAACMLQGGKKYKLTNEEC